MSVATPRPKGVKYPIKLNNNETALAQVVKAYGPVSVAISVNVNFSLYKSGIYNDPSCTGRNLNHEVLCVGYGTENGTDYWCVTLLLYKIYFNNFINLDLQDCEKLVE